MRTTACIALILLFAFSCKKKDPPPPPEPETPVIPADTGLGCRSLPPEPSPFGWEDTTGNPDQNINCFMMNPLNPNEMIYVANGDLFGYNKMFLLNIPTGQSKLLATTGRFVPQVNKQGWIVFSSVDDNIFKIKVTGDSLTQLTNQKTTTDPKWDHTGKFIYYFQIAHTNVLPQIIKITASGAFVDALPAEMPYHAPFKKSDKILFMKTKDNFVTIWERDLDLKEERALITATYTTKAAFHFDNLSVDNSDQFMFWCNAGGVFRCSLSSLVIDTLLKSCPNYQFDNPVQVPWKPDELSVSCHYMRPLGQNKLLHEYRAYEYNVLSRGLNQLKVFH